MGGGSRAASNKKTIIRKDLVPDPFLSRVEVLQRVEVPPKSRGYSKGRVEAQPRVE